MKEKRNPKENHDELHQEMTTMHSPPREGDSKEIPRTVNRKESHRDRKRHGEDRATHRPLKVETGAGAPLAPQGFPFLSIVWTRQCT